MAEANVTRAGFLAMQVCVPKEWNDEQVRRFAEKENMCGTENGWFLRKYGNPLLAGDAERVTCEEHPENVHIMLDA